MVMKKQELIHLHGLLAEVSNQCAAWDDCRISLDAYESLGIRPTSIHKSKTDHKAAVFALAGGITEHMREGETEVVAATAD
ncbi:UPF0058 family protein [Natronobiforma cellulositropha]